jgi:membrane protease YdiL (CAAX protease family)
VLIVEFLFLAAPLNLAYGFAMGSVYRLSVFAGLAFALLGGFAAISGYSLFARYLVKRVPDELAVARSPDLARGIALGTALIVAAVAIVALAGDLKLGMGGWPTLAGLPGVALLAGVYEELIARGVVFRNLENVFGSEIAIALSAALFGWLHLGNPHATTLSALAVGLEGGVLLAAVYMAMRSLWWTIGVHMAWNFTETGVFGIADSGNPGRGLLHAELAGPQWLTGGVFGIEASAVAVILCLAAAVWFLVRAYRMGRFVAPLWERRR